MVVGFDEKKTQLSQWEYAFAGAMAGASTRFLGQPFDVLKIRFQLQVEPVSKKSESSKYHAMFQATRTIIAEEGMLGLWKGHLSGQYLSITYGIIQFQTFELFTKLSEEYLKTGARSPTVHAVCGGIAGTLATIGSFPFDTIRTRLVAQGQEKMYFSIYDAIKRMVVNEGPLSLFKGLTPAILLVAPQSAAIFTFHNYFTSLFNRTKFASENELKLVGNLIVGSLAGLCGKTLVYPLDLSRKRLQLQGFEGRKGFGENFRCRDLVNCLYLTVKKEGLSGMYKGLVPSIWKAAITTALHFTVYDEICKFLILLKEKKP